MDISQYKSLSTHALVATTLFLTLGLITVVSIISTVAEIGLLQQIAAGGPISEADANRNDSRQALLGYLYIVGFVAAAIAFLAWLNRASNNLATLGVAGQRFSPGWAVGWWFVPIFWLWRPYQVVKEVWQGSHPATGTGGPGELEETLPLSPPVGLLVGSMAGLQLGQHTSRPACSSPATRYRSSSAADWLSVISSVISLVALALATRPGPADHSESIQGRHLALRDASGNLPKRPESPGLPNDSEMEDR